MPKIEIIDEMENIKDEFIDGGKTIDYWLKHKDNRSEVINNDKLKVINEREMLLGQNPHRDKCYPNPPPQIHTIKKNAFHLRCEPHLHTIQNLPQRKLGLQVPNLVLWFFVNLKMFLL